MKPEEEVSIGLFSDVSEHVSSEDQDLSDAISPYPKAPCTHIEDT